MSEQERERHLRGDIVDVGAARRLLAEEQHLERDADLLEQFAAPRRGGGKQE